MSYAISVLIFPLNIKLKTFPHVINILFKFDLGGCASCGGPGWHFNFTRPPFPQALHLLGG